MQYTSDVSLTRGRATIVGVGR